MKANATMLQDKVKQAKEWLAEDEKKAKEHIEAYERAQTEHDENMLKMVNQKQKLERKQQEQAPQN